MNNLSNDQRERDDQHDRIQTLVRSQRKEQTASGYRICEKYLHYLLLGESVWKHIVIHCYCTFQSKVECSTDEEIVENVTRSSKTGAYSQWIHQVSVKDIFLETDKVITVCTCRL